MQNVSEEYLKAFRSRTKVDRIEGFILLTDGTVLNITEKDIVQGGLQTKNRVCGSSFDLGTFNVGEMQIRFIDNESLNHDFAGAMINLRYCLLIDKDNDTWEKVYIKPYFIDGESVKRKRNVISCRAYDNASKFDVEKPSEIVGLGLFEILTEICGFCNVPLVTTQEEFDSFPNADIIPDLSSTQIQSCRDIVMWIAQTVNCCAFIDYTGKVKLKPYSYEREQQDRNVYASERKSIEFSDSRTYLAYLSSYCNGEPKSYQLVHSFSGVDAEHVKEGAFSMPKNPLLAKLTPKQQDDVNKAYLDNAQFPARYIKAKGWVDPSLEVLDVLRFVGGDIDIQKAIRNSLTEVIWKFRGDGTYTCNIVDEYSEEANLTSDTSTFSADTSTRSATTLAQRVSPKSQLEKRLDDLESRISSGGTGAGTLTEYNVLSDTSVKYNGTTYTAELADSGLISKITDDQGGEFSPTYADGVTDVALHNAAFLAVAMLSGLALYDCLTPMCVYRFNADKMTQESDTITWNNQADSSYTDDLLFIGGSVNARENSVYVRGTQSSYGHLSYICKVYETDSLYNDTIYLVAKTATADALRTLQTPGRGPQASAVALTSDSGNWAFRSDATSSRISTTSEPSTKKSVIVIRNNVFKADVFINGQFLFTTSSSGVISGEMWIGRTQNSYYDGGYYIYDLACAGSLHSDEDIVRNSRYLMRKYNIGGTFIW